MQLSLEARQRIHERYERQSVSERRLEEGFQVSLMRWNKFLSFTQKISAVVLTVETFDILINTDINVSLIMDRNIMKLFQAHIAARSIGNMPVVVKTSG